MNNAQQELLARFEGLQISAPDFHHRDHVLVAYAMLEKHDFVEACARYGRTIRALAEGAGVPEKYNVTITIAFMSLVAERKTLASYTDVESFLSANADLLEKGVLSAWYSAERLTSARARGQFLLPDRVGGV